MHLPPGFAAEDAQVVDGPQSNRYFDYSEHNIIGRGKTIGFELYGVNNDPG